MDKLKKLSRELLAHLGVKSETIKITEDKTGSVGLEVAVDEAEAGILIGYHGETIAALQLLLGMMLYRQKRTDYLTALAQDTAVKVAETGEPLALYNLNPFERRIVHVALSERKEIVTESQGEGKSRFLVVSPKQ